MGQDRQVYRFGTFQLDPAERRLLRDGQPVPLPPKPFDLLVTLVEHRGRLVEKAALMQALWPDTIVEEANLTFQVFTLRKVLDAEGSGESVIQTVPTKGYRFVAPVSIAGQTPPKRRTRAVRGAVSLLALGGVGALSALLVREIGSATVAPAEVLPLTTLPGYELAGSLSPDGQTVAFLWDAGTDEPLHLFVKRVDSSAVRRVTSGAEPDSAGAWSSDGQQLALLRFRGNVGRAHIVSVADGADRVVSDFPAARSAGIDWSPDGKTLLVTRAVEKPEGSQMGGLFLIPVQGGEPRQITWPDQWESHSDAAFSPDGHSIAFVSCKGTHCDAYVLGLNADSTPAGAPRRITSQAGWGMPRLTWTHDSTAIIYDLYATPSIIGLWRVTTDGKAPPVRLESAGFRAHAPMLARDRDRLVFTRGGLDDVDIYRLQVDQTPTNWFTSSFSDDSPQYSVDGKRVAFATSSSGVSEEIWIAEADGSNPHPLTHGPGRWQGSPRFSPDGTRVAFDSCCSDGHVHLWSIDADGGTPRQLTTSNTSDQNIPSWSADGQYIYFTDDRDGRRNLWKIRSSGGPPEQVTTIGTGLVARISEDGQNVLYQSDGADLPLMMLPLRGGAPRELIPCVPQGAFAERGRRLYYATCPKGDSLDTEITCATS